MPYGLFDYIPDSTIHTMGKPIVCPQDIRRCPDGTVLRRNSSRGCSFPPCPPAKPPMPKCQPLITQNGCNYKLA